MTNEIMLTAMYDKGRADALGLQSRAAEMTGTELNAEGGCIPAFTEAVKVMNMLDRHADRSDGFVCKSSAGRVVRLIQNYDNTVYPGEPEIWPAFYRFVWSKDPKKALPFIALSTSPYDVGECCTEDYGVYSSMIANNVNAPSAYPAGWKYLGGISEIIGGDA